MKSSEESFRSLPKTSRNTREASGREKSALERDHGEEEGGQRDLIRGVIALQIKVLYIMVSSDLQ